MDEPTTTDPPEEDSKVPPFAAMGHLARMKHKINKMLDDKERRRFW